MDLKGGGRESISLLSGCPTSCTPLCKPMEKPKAWEHLGGGARVWGNLCALSPGWGSDNREEVWGGCATHSACTGCSTGWDTWAEAAGSSLGLLEGMGSNQEVVPSSRPGTVHALLLLVTSLLSCILHFISLLSTHLVYGDHLDQFPLFLAQQIRTVLSIALCLSYRHSGFYAWAGFSLWDCLWELESLTQLTCQSLWVIMACVLSITLDFILDSHMILNIISFNFCNIPHYVLI